MALTLGVLNVLLKADAGGLSKGIEQGLKQVEKFERRIKKLGNEVGKVGLAMGAALAGAFALASTGDSQIKATFERTRALMLTFAVTISRMLLPAIRAFNQTLGQVITYFQQMNPHTRQMIADWALLAVKVLAGVAVFSKLSGVVSALAGLASIVAPLMPVLLAVAAVAAIIAIDAAIIRAVWEENFLGIRDIVNAVWEDVAGSTGVLLTYLKVGFTELGNGLAAVFDFILSSLAKQIRGLIDVVIDLKRHLHLDTSFEAMMSTALAFFEKAPLGAKLAAGADVARAAWKRTAKAMGDNFDDLKKKIAGLLPDFGKLGGPKMSISDKDAKAQAELDKTLMEQRNKFFADLQKGVEEQTRVAVERMKVEDEFNEHLAKVMKREVDIRETALIGLKQGMVDKVLDATGPAGAMLHDANDAAKFGAGAAVGSVALDLVLQSKGFQDTIKVVTSVVQSLADVLGSFLKPLQPLIAALMTVVEAVGGFLAPAFGLLADLLDPLTPIIVLLGTILKALTPAFGILITIMLAIQAPLLFLTAAAMPALFVAFKYVGLALLNIVKAIVGVWNGVLSGIQDVLFAIGNVLGADGLGKPLLALGMMLENLKDYSNYDQQISDLDKMTMASAKAKADDAAATVLNTAATEQATAAAEKFSEQLTNVPDGFKVQAARFAATQPFSLTDGLQPSMMEAGAMTLNFLAPVYGFDDFEVRVAEASKKARQKQGGGF